MNLLNSSTNPSEKIPQLLSDGRRHYYAGEYFKAIDIFYQVLSIDPANQEAKERLIQAEDNIKRGIVPDTIVPFEARVAYGKAQSLERAGRLDEARKTYKLAIEEASKVGDLFRNWQPPLDALARIENAIIAEETRREANSLMQDDNWLEAIQKYKAVLDLIPDDSQARNFIELLPLVQNEVAPLEASLQKAKILPYRSDTVAEIAGKLFELSQRFPYLSYSPRLHKALDETEHLLARLREFEELVEVGKREISIANFENAIQYLEKAKEIAPNRSLEAESLLNDAKQLLSLSQEYYALLGRGRELLDNEDYKAAADVLCQAARLAEEHPEIIEPSRRQIAIHLCTEARDKLKAFEEMQKYIYDAEIALQNGDSCMAVDILMKVIKIDLIGKRANELREKAKELRVKAVILCAEKIAAEGGYSRAKSLLEPYAENAAVSKAIEKVTARQNSEAEARKRHRSEYLEELKSQSEIWFKWAVRASVLGAILLLAGAIGAFFGQIQSSIVVAISSILPSGFAKFFIDQYRELRTERLSLLTKTPKEEDLEIEAQKQAMGLNKTQEKKQDPNRGAG